MLAEPISYENPRNGDVIESRFTNQEAIDIIAKQTDNDFCQSLAKQYNERGLSQAQWFWAHKLAHQHNKPTHKIELNNSIYEWLQDTGLKRLMWKVEVPSDAVTSIKLKGKKYARIKLYINEHEIAVVHSGGDNSTRVGVINKDSEYVQNNRVPNNVQVVISTQLMMLAKYKMDFMQAYGKEFGVCFVCGRELENEESVRLGIGPICRERFG